MALALKTDTATTKVRRPFLRLLSVEADLTCLMCGRTVGEVVNGRAVQHAGCGGRLRLERGVIRCCHCNGPVYREALPTVAPR